MRHEFPQSDLADSHEGERITDVAVAHGYFPDQSRVWFVVARQADGQVWRTAHQRLGMAGALMTAMLNPAATRLEPQVSAAELTDLSEDSGHSPETNRENASVLRQLASRMRAQARVLCHIARVRRNLSQSASPDQPPTVDS